MALIDKEKLINEMNARDENIELPKHTNSLPLTVDDRVKPCEKLDVIPIPEGATNGEMMKKMMKIMFPDLKIEIEGTHITCWIDEHRWFAPDYDWWNTPYKREKWKNE